MEKERYQIISDSSCDLTLEMAEKLKVKIVPFYVSFDDKNYKKEIVEIGVEEFYHKMADNPKVFPKSSLPSVQDYVDTFLPFVKEQIAIICICITTKFSGSFQAANNAKEIIKESHPEAEITVIDATVNTVLQGIFVREAARMQQNGLKYEEVIANLERIKSSGRIFFTIGNIDYLKHGGRIGKLAGIAAGTLNLKPIITLKEGEIFPSGISRSRAKSKQKVIDLLLEYLEERKEPLNDYNIVVGFGLDRKEAEEFKEQVCQALETKYGKTEIGIYQIGATIGVHTGPLPIGIGIMQRYDV